MITGIQSDSRLTELVVTDKQKGVYKYYINQDLFPLYIQRQVFTLNTYLEIEIYPHIRKSVRRRYVDSINTIIDRILEKLFRLNDTYKKNNTLIVTPVTLQWSSMPSQLYGVQIDIQLLQQKIEALTSMYEIAPNAYLRISKDIKSIYKNVITWKTQLEAKIGVKS